MHPWGICNSRVYLVHVTYWDMKMSYLTWSLLLLCSSGWSTFGCVGNVKGRGFAHILGDFGPPRRGGLERRPGTVHWSCAIRRSKERFSSKPHEALSTGDRPSARCFGRWVTCTCFSLAKPDRRDRSRAKPDRRDRSRAKLPQEVVWLNVHPIRIVVNAHSVWML